MNPRWLYLQVHERFPARRAPALPASRGPLRDWRYRAWIRSLPSAVSGRYGCEAAHTGTDGGMGLKPSDSTCVPLTPDEHREYHQIGKAAFERGYGLNLTALVRRLRRDWFVFGSLVK